jgi:NAD(P)-dependent dehydrogenase (short-subunit alcohol dehydrogenase family)
MSDTEHNGKVAFVTGAGSGIGRATAIAFARAGAKVAISDIDPETGAQTEALIRQAGGTSFFMPCDVSNRADVQAKIDETVGRYGRLDFACNNAGISGPLRRVQDWNEEDFDTIVGVNLKGLWLCMKYEIQQMVRQGGGVIINLSSVAGLVGMRGMSIYCGAKHGVVGLTKSAALELAPHNIRVNALCPGGIETGMSKLAERSAEEREAFMVMTPLGRTGLPDDIASVILFLCSDKASFVTGHCMTIDGGRLAQAGPFPPTPEAWR